MARELKPIDISNTPELLRLAEEVQRTQEPRVLVREDEELAVLVPVESTVAPAKPSRSRSRRTKGSANPNDWLLRLVDIAAETPPADRPTDVSANKHKYLAEAYYAKTHKSPRR
jgi:hypothetical protein